MLNIQTIWKCSNVQMIKFLFKFFNTDDCNLNKKQKILAVFDEMMSGIVSNKKTEPEVTKF